MFWLSKKQNLVKRLPERISVWLWTSLRVCFSYNMRSAFVVFGDCYDCTYVVAHWLQWKPLRSESKCILIRFQVSLIAYNRFFEHYTSTVPCKNRRKTKASACWFKFIPTFVFGWNLFPNFVGFLTIVSQVKCSNVFQPKRTFRQIVCLKS